MYAFTNELRVAWEAIFEGLVTRLPSPWNQAIEIDFEHAPEELANPRLLIGHTCGYPYVHRWHRSHRLLAVPGFDIPGCTGAMYSSWLIANSNSSRDSLEDFRGSRAAYNNPDSNSGMNVFRHAISTLHKDGTFFASTLESGSHLTSMQMVKDGEADLAAIDAVTYGLAIRQGLFSADDFKIVGRSRETHGLPLVVTRGLPLNDAELLEALGGALADAPRDATDTLGITAFHPVSDSDYDDVRTVESEAIANGYPSLG